ncbi:MAG: hypothetical protein KDF65_01945, partial [Anaerolineae bacterium]|nr:hypothetical protein [Anaerolineae bacterium]
MRQAHSFCLLLVGLFVGCTAPVSTPANETTSPTDAMLAAEPIKTATIAAEPTSVATPLVTATPPVMPTPTVVATDTPAAPMVCDQVPAYGNLREETNDLASILMDFFFEDENQITFLMWSDRPNFDTRPFPINYSWTLLRGLTWDYEGNVLTGRSITDQQPLQTPYLEDYPVDVVSVSPNNEWQLLQVTEAPEEYQGFWLVNQEMVTQIIPYVPYSPNWQWSDDSEMLWLEHLLYDISGDSYASQTVIVDLVGPEAPKTVNNFRDTDISPDLTSSHESYELVFSPAHKTALSYERLDIDEALLNQPLTAYLYDVAQNPPQQIEMFAITPPVFIDWSHTLEAFVIIELSATGGEIYTLDRSLVYQIPIEIIKLMPNFLSARDQGRTDASVAAYLNANLYGLGI